MGNRYVAQAEFDDEPIYIIDLKNPELDLITIHRNGNTKTEIELSKKIADLLNQGN